MFNFLTKLLDSNEKEIARLRKIAEEINAKKADLGSKINDMRNIEEDYKKSRICKKQSFIFWR